MVVPETAVVPATFENTPEPSRGMWISF